MTRRGVFEVLAQIERCAKVATGKDLLVSVHLITGPRPFGTFICADRPIHWRRQLGRIVILPSNSHKQKEFRWEDIFQVTVTISP